MYKVDNLVINLLLGNLIGQFKLVMVQVNNQPMGDCCGTPETPLIH